ncbi:KH domain-containing protein [bacterium]|nr:KH domain-containing protein [bacterium]
MKEFIEYLVKHLVDKPEEVRIHEIAGERTIVFELHVGDGDIGKVIGRHGQNALALRTLLAAAAAKQGKRFIFEILEDGKEKTPGSQRKKVNDQ